MKKNFVLACFLATAAFSGCNKIGSKNETKEDGFTIKGKLQNQASGNIYLSELGEQQFVYRDTAEVKSDGSFEFTGKADDPGIYRISLNDQNMVLLVVDTQRIEVTADAKDLRKTSTIKGSKETDNLKAVESVLNGMQEDGAKLEKRFVAAQNARQEDSLPVLQQKFMDLQKANSKKLKAIIRSKPNSVVSAFATLSLINPDEEFAFADSMATAYNKTIPDSKFTKALTSKLSTLRNVAVGQPAPDINLPTPDGKSVSLSSLRGKYVLVDFWASWCGPCRQENPNVVRMYNQYKDKGFEIFGVSLDESREKWLKAIDADKLTWPHVSDLKGWESSAAKLYNIQAIPQTLLLDKEGKIIAKNLRGPSLEEKLASLLK
ncbi:TlpA disulfide reductase family protein [Adhaeribacter rhizoryzae]|uniref:AhpC/TSA family protein n=1 Tax=Adhaeribacter rhizoryzae TaxID=2607907 RepID=A0A5M6DK97_9BACT|nr:TlpA disulfide reductase family protein [Adhaeribacter rhizoryzae]KAA5547893.1 AhpC/TSA family protein [Adhaeribacter rhizoryzae]